jgi:hypothetical protein
MKKHIAIELTAAPLSIDVAALAATTGGMPSSSSSSGRSHFGKQPNELQQGTFDYVYRDRDSQSARSDKRSIDTAAGPYDNIRANNYESFTRNGHHETKRKRD